MFHLALSVPLARLVRLAVAVLSTSLLAGCLEANATTAPADGGKESGGGRTGDSGRTGTPDTGKTGADATKSGHGDASSDSGGGASSCLHATATQTACGECAAGACKSSLSASETACPGFYACFAKCDCSDATCIGNCYTAAPATCQSSLGTFTSCQSSMCASACTPGDGGAVTDSGAHGDASADSCKNPTATELACGACDETMCKSDVTAAQAACASFYTCFAGCDCSSTSCIDGCAVAAPSSCQTALETLNSCQSSKCSSACSGSGKDAGGTSGTIPDCANPTSTEASTYTACSACDTASCASDVAAAVSACTAYYACFGATDCASALTVCAADITAGCQTAVDALAVCQNTNCLLPCSGL